MIVSFEENGLIDGKDIMERVFHEVFRQPLPLEDKFRCFWVTIITDTEFYNVDMEEAESLIKQAFVDSLLHKK